MAYSLVDTFLQQMEGQGNGYVFVFAKADSFEELRRACHSEEVFAKAQLKRIQYNYTVIEGPGREYVREKYCRFLRESSRVPEEFIQYLEDEVFSCEHFMCCFIPIFNYL